MGYYYSIIYCCTSLLLCCCLKLKIHFGVFVSFKVLTNPRIRSEYAEWATSRVRQHLPSELSFLVTSDHIRLNEERNPLLSTAISTNKRLIIFVPPTLLSSPRYLHRLHQVENVNYGYAISNCFDAFNIENGILADARANVGYFALQINWFNTQGLCNGHLAGVCDGEELTKLEVIQNLTDR